MCHFIAKIPLDLPGGPVSQTVSTTVAASAKQLCSQRQIRSISRQSSLRSDIRTSSLHDSAANPAPKRLKVPQQQQKQLISQTGTVAQVASKQPKPVMSATAQQQQRHIKGTIAATTAQQQQKCAFVKTATAAHADSKQPKLF